MSQQGMNSERSSHTGPSPRQDAPIDCASARLRLLAEDPRVAEHLAGCPACRERLDQLSVAVLSDRVDEIPCAECRAWLPELIATGPRAGAVGASEPESAALLRAWSHVDRCPECHAAWLLAGAAMAELGRPDLPQPPREPAIDTGFLRPARSWRLPPLGAVAAVALLALGLGTGALYLRGRGPAALEATPPRTEARPSESAIDQAAARATHRSQRTPAADTPLTPRPGANANATAGDGAVGQPIALAPARPSPSPGSTPRVAGPIGVGETPSPSPQREPASPGPTEAPEPEASRRPPEASPTPTPEMGTLCMLEAYGPVDAYLNATCDRFPASSAYDVYRLDVREASRWTFSLCARTQLDTILALYPLGGFDPNAPCSGLVAYNDDYCGRQSRLSLDLTPGAYLLVLTEKTGDLSDLYAIRVGRSLAAPRESCPVAWRPSPTPLATSSPTATRPSPPATAGPTVTASATVSATAPPPSPSSPPASPGPSATASPPPTATATLAPPTPTPLAPTPAPGTPGPTLAPTLAPTVARARSSAGSRPGSAAERWVDAPRTRP